MAERISPQLRRALELGARLKQAQGIAAVLLSTLLRWPGSAPRSTAPRPAGSGATLFEVELCGRAFAVTVEPLTIEAAARIAWQPSAPQKAQEETDDQSR